MTKEQLAKRIKGAYIPVQIDSIQDCPSYSCFIVNDLVLLSYSEAQFLYARNKHCSRLAKVVTNPLVRWLVIALYNVFIWSVRQPEYMIIKTKAPKGKPWPILRRMKLRRLNRRRQRLKPT